MDTEEPRGIWVPICFAWPVLSKIFLIPVILLLTGFLFWALGRMINKLSACIDDYPLIDAIELFAFLSNTAIAILGLILIVLLRPKITKTGRETL